MEQRWTLTEETMSDLREWLRTRGQVREGAHTQSDRLTVEVKPDPKCKFCGAGEIHHSGLCLFCYCCLPHCAFDELTSCSSAVIYSKEEWIKMFRETARSAHKKGMLK